MMAWTILLKDSGNLSVLVSDAPHGEMTAWRHFYNIYGEDLAAIIPGKNPVYFERNKT